MKQHRFSREVLLFLTVVLAVSLPAYAKSPVIADQQLKYKAAKQIWEKKHLPKGLAGDATFNKQEKHPTARSSGTPRTAMLLNNVDFGYAGGIGFSVKRLVISLEPKKRGAPADLDKVDSFVIRLHRGEIVMHSSALSALFNKHVLDYPGHSLADMKMKTAKGRLYANGTMVLCNCLGDVGVSSSMSGAINLTPDNKLVFKLDKIESLGISVIDVLKALNISLPTLISIERPGIKLKDFSIEMDHRKMFPFPELAGDIADVNLQNDGLHLTFADAPNAKLDPPSTLEGSYIWIQSGDPKFYGAVVMNARIVMKPMKARQKLRFDLYNYRKQLSTAKAKLHKDGSLVVRIP